MPRILIVDDDENNRAVASDALESDNYELVEAVDGHDCLRQVTAQPFDLILLDVMMPGIDGIATLRHLKANDATRGIPVIMVTALNMDSQVAACLDEGAIDHVSKPFSTMVLRARVRAALRAKAPAGAGNANRDQGKVLAFVGVKGGAGTTTLAINVGAHIAQSGKKSIVCEMQFDAVSSAVQLGITPRQGSQPLFGEDGDCVSRATIEQNLLRHGSGIRLLLGPPESECDGPSPESIGSLVGSLRGMYPCTILDAGTGQSSAGRELLRQADQVVMVMELEPCSLIAAHKRLKRFAELDIHPELLSAVINHRIQIPLPAVGLDFAREKLSCDIIGVIPADPEGCSMAVKQRTPLCLFRPQSTAAGAMVELANRLGVDQPSVLVG